MGLSSESEAPPTDKGKGVGQDPMLWGVPGHLTKSEVDVYMQFKTQVYQRNDDFIDTLYSFGKVEGECWCLTRWLRARKYILADVLTMVDEATKVRADAKAAGFYPDPKVALGVDTAIYIANYPQLYTGRAKSGVPLYISKPGVLNVDAIECITTLDGIVKYHWHVMMHDFANRLRATKEEDPDRKRCVQQVRRACEANLFHTMISSYFRSSLLHLNICRFECLCVLDLAGLTTAQLTSRALAIIKEQSAIDSVCFPETMHKMLIVNSPTFFTATWRIIKGWLDPRTAAKIEVISSKSAGEKRLLELVDADLLPTDYGGNAKDTETLMDESGATGGVGGAYKVTNKMMYTRYVFGVASSCCCEYIVTHPLHFSTFCRGSSSETFEILAGQQVAIQVFTRSIPGGKFHLTNADTKQELGPIVEVKHTGNGDEAEMPTHASITKERIQGPLKLKIKAESNAGRFARQNFLVVFQHFKA